MRALAPKTLPAQAKETGVLLQRQIRTQPSTPVADKTRVATSPVIEGPIGKVPEQKGKRPQKLRVAAVSFLACAPCNPFTDDGASAVTPPAKEPQDKNGFRMKHWVEIDIPAKGDPVSNAEFRQQAGVSGYCGNQREAATILTQQFAKPNAFKDPIHGTTTTLISGMGTRVGAVVPPTLPLAPCGDLGHNAQIPLNWNRMRIDVSADGWVSSYFEAASSFPYHYLYENGQLKTYGGAPYHPAVDYKSWAGSTGIPLALSEAGFTALGMACCNNGVFPKCKTLCAGGKSIPLPTQGNLEACAEMGLRATFGSCRSKNASCSEHGTDCPGDLKKAANP